MASQPFREFSQSARSDAPNFVADQAAFDSRPRRQPKAARRPRRPCAECARLESQIRQTQKMDAVGQLAGGIAHDFNNLLQAINGYTELAARAVAPDHLAQNMLQQVLRTAERAAALTSQLLTFSRLEALKSERLHLNAVVTGFSRVINRVIGDHIQLVLVEGSSLPAIQADQNQVEQILMNLCINGRDAMAGGGALTVETGHTVLSDDDCRERAWARPGHWAFFRVADEGCGIPEHIRPHVFEPFFTTKAAGRGTGLGLATVYAIVERHGGLIAVDTATDVGTTFTIYFPAAGPAAEAMDAVSPAPAEDAPTSLDAGGGETVLVAEDEACVRELVVEVLEAEGYTVIVAVDGAEAEAIVHARAAEIDLAVLDIAMPFRSGRQVYETLQQVRAGVPVIFCSGYGFGELGDGASAPFAAVLSKPYSWATLLATVRRAIGSKPGCGTTTTMEHAGATGVRLSSAAPPGGWKGPHTPAPKEFHAPLIPWIPALSVRVGHLDEQHQEFVTLINSLDDAMAQGKGKDVLGRILSNLVTHSVWHFTEEKKLFDTLGYPHAAAHVAEHERFTAEVTNTLADFDSGKQAMSIQIIDFLTNWLFTHVCGSDQKYTEFFNENGVR